MRGRRRDIQDVAFLFYGTEENYNHGSWNTTISVYPFNSDVEVSVSLFNKMRATTGVITICGRNSCPVGCPLGKGSMSRSPMRPARTTSKFPHRHVDRAYEIFQCLRLTTTPAWSTFLLGQ
ncbi:hypothetical protein EJ110_NYTH32861 [Nymphaea thermarum]|nr:hypothetical protein EJ110_NYTH32861 [Nymphaea thermarum]